METQAADGPISRRENEQKGGGTCTRTPGLWSGGSRSGARFCKERERVNAWIAVPGDERHLRSVCGGDRRYSSHPCKTEEPCKRRKYYDV